MAKTLKEQVAELKASLIAETSEAKAQRVRAENAEEKVSELEDQYDTALNEIDLYRDTHDEDQERIAQLEKELDEARKSGGGMPKSIDDLRMP